MDLSQLRYFLSVADHRSFTRAAEELFVSQPTVSKQIALLEKELGVKLFVRNKNGIGLTYIGQILYPDFRDALALINTAIQKAAKTTEDVRGKINVGIGSMMDINYIMPGFFRAFSQVYPGIQLRITSHTFSELQKRLAGGELDVIFTYSLEKLQRANQARMEVSRSHSFLYYSRILAPPDRDVCSLRDFTGIPFLHLQNQASDKFRSQFSAGFSNTMEVPDMETMILYLESGLGVSVMGRSYRISIGDTIHAIDLTESDGLPEVGTDVIWNRGNRNPSLKLLLDEARLYIEGRSGLPPRSCSEQ